MSGAANAHVATTMQASVPQPSHPSPSQRPPAGFVQGVRVGLCGLAFLGFALGGAVLAWLVLPIVARWPGSSQAQSRKRCQRVVRAAWIFFHDYMRVVGLVAFNHRRMRLPAHAPAVIIANHPTLIDITALVSALGPVCFVAKKPLFKNPIYGALLRACGHIGSLDADGDEGQSALDQALARLAAGHSVLLFPEGTRSPVGGLGRFRMGAFALARQAQVPLVVVSVTARPLGLNKGVPWYAIPAQAMTLSLEHEMTFNDWSSIPDLHALAALRTTIRQRLLARVHPGPAAVPVAAPESVPGTLNLTQA
ncbi:MAG: lysophospholipid acyltransferase family protein [Deltaproteobacteria bacterium]|nr:lysophospholipid acyltransferase family protein [Deltaproteobacteria bacterium]